MTESAGRKAEPHEDDIVVQRIEIEFAIPVFIPQSALRELDGLLSSIVRLKMNQLEGFAHWVSGYGSKPLWSQADARFLGKTPADDAPASGEPSFDDSVYHIETSCVQRADGGKAGGRSYRMNGQDDMLRPPCCEGKAANYECNCHCHGAKTGESAGRARLIEQLIADAQEAETQAGIFSRRNWGVLNEQGNVEVLPGLLDKLSVRLESIAKGLRAAAEALAGQEEAPHDEKRCEVHLRALARDIGMTWQEGRETDPQIRGALFQTFKRLIERAKAEEDATAPPRSLPYRRAGHSRHDPHAKEPR